MNNEEIISVAVNRETGLIESAVARSCPEYADWLKWLIHTDYFQEDLTEAEFFSRMQPSPDMPPTAVRVH